MSGKERRGAFQKPRVVKQHREDELAEKEQDRKNQRSVLAASTLLATLAEDDRGFRKHDFTEHDMSMLVDDEDTDIDHGLNNIARDAQHQLAEDETGIHSEEEAASAEVRQCEDTSMEDVSPSLAEVCSEDVIDDEDAMSAAGHLDDIGDITNTAISYGILSQIQSLLVHKSRRIFGSNIINFRFSWSPTSLEDVPGDLDTSHVGNADYISFSAWLHEHIELLRDQDPSDDPDLNGRLNAISRELTGALDRLETMKSLAWTKEMIRAGLYGGGRPVPRTEAVYIRTEHWFKPINKEPFLLAILFTVTALHTLAAVSRPQSMLLLTTLRLGIFGVFTYANCSRRLQKREQSLLEEIPVDVRTAIKHLALEPAYTTYACCPDCFFLHPPTLPSTSCPYPRNCTNHRIPGQGPCGASLLKKSTVGRKVKWVPVRPYAYQSLQTWISQLLSRPGMEKSIEKSWKAPDTGVWADIMHAPVIQRFQGPDGATRFSVQPNGSLHLVFSLFIDWFNPFGNKKAGKSYSMGAIYMACLNLPENIRFKPENVYLAGLIPGPSEPRLNEINGLLQPLVDDLLTLWHRGLLLSKTSSRAYGRMVRAAMIPLVCDLPALRKAAGFASYSSGTHPCSFCLVGKHDVNDLDRDLPRRSWKEHLAIALQWRDASSVADRDTIFKDHGIRWSELLRLPYWDPTRYAVVDAMHNLYLGVLRHHCMEVLGVDMHGRPTDEQKIAPHTPEEQTAWLEAVVEGIRAKSASATSLARKGYIVAVAQLNGVVPENGEVVKKAYVDALIKWYSSGRPEIQVPRALEKPTTDFKLLNEPSDLATFKLLAPEVLIALRQDISKTFLPSWMAYPPRNFGSLGHGKLKADQWKTTSTVCMVITLVRLWGSPSASTLDREMLKNFVHLITAVKTATRRTMTWQRAETFDHHIYEYLKGLRSIFSHDLVPNHHLSLHLKECLQSFGPVQGWWAFPFERYNGLIAKTKSNNKPNEMAITFFRYFCIGTSLRQLVSSVSWPQDPYFQQWLDAYRSVFPDAILGIRGTPIPSHAPIYDSSKATPLAPSIYEALLSKINSSQRTQFVSILADDALDSDNPALPNDAQRLTKIQVGSLDYGTRRRSLRNSFVLFASPTGTVIPGQIVDIFRHTRHDGRDQYTEDFCVVCAFKPLGETDIAHDPYRAYPDLAACLYYHEFTTQETGYVLRPHEIVSHFAAYVYTPENIKRECVLVLSLDRS